MSVESMERIYDKIGGLGRMQIISICFIYSTMIGVSWSMMQMAFGGIIPDWHCVLDNATESELLRMKTSPNADRLVTFKVCDVNGTTCDRYLFENSLRTVINEWSLVCDLQWVKATVTSLQMLGVFLGTLVGGYLGDHFGRKKPLYSFLLYNVAVNVVTAFSTSWLMFGAFRFLCGFGSGGLLSLTHPYALEMAPLKWRAFVGGIPAWAIGCCIFALNAFVFKHWAYLHLACGLTFAPILLGWFFVPESVRWLAVHGKVDEAMQVLQLMAKRNGRDLPTEAKRTVENIYRQEKALQSTHKKYNYTDLFRPWRMAKLTLVFCFMWCFLSMVYYGLAFGVPSLSGNFYLNIILLTAISVPLYPVLGFLQNRVGRRLVAIVLSMVSFGTAVGCLVIQTREPFAGQDVLLNVMAVSSILAIDTTWVGVQTWASEAYPTVTRSLAFGAYGSAARVGGIVAPFVIDLDHRLVISYLVVAGLCVLLAAASLLPPETKGAKLADSIQTSDCLGTTLQEETFGALQKSDVDQEMKNLVVRS